jgi:hypothetical protein
MLTVTVSGSFHRHMDAITSAVHELASVSVRVLSPADPRIVAQQGDFLFVASDAVRSVRLVQDRHLECIRASSFLWLVCPDGYVGQSASMELGFAAAAGVPIFSMRAPSDLTLQQYVTVVPALGAALSAIRMRSKPQRSPGILIDPRASIEQAHYFLDRIGSLLAHSSSAVDPLPLIRKDLTSVNEKLALPTYAH